MKAIPYFLVAGGLMLGTACSTTNAGSGASSTSGADTGMNSGTGAGTGSTSGSSGSTSGSAGTYSSMGATGTGAGTTAGTGTAGGAGTIATAGTSGTAGAGGATGAAAAADPTAFMATFATMQDPVFLINAASSNLLEIQAAQIAVQKASNPDVRKFAQMMDSHHRKATQDLKAVALPLGTTPPQTLLPVHQAMLDRLTNKTGKDFDEAYMDLMETAHRMDIAMFEVKSKRADTPQVQSFASRTLPMLRSHEKMASDIEKKVD